jgi:spermidine/putrescine transport system permease protein
VTEPRRYRDHILRDLHVGLVLLFLIAPVLVALAAGLGVSFVPAGDATKTSAAGSLSALLADTALMRGLAVSVLVGLAVTAVAVPLGLAGALTLDRLSPRAAAVLFAAMIAPVLVPGLAVGLATSILWRHLGIENGAALVILAQSSRIAACTMALFLMRLASLDRALERTAVDLGASPALVMRHIFAPHLAPMVPIAAIAAFVLSFVDHDATIAAIGTDRTFVTELSARIVAGPSPAIDATGLVGALLVIAALAVIVVNLKHKCI